MIDQRSFADDRYSEWGAAYVLGSLSPSERREFDAHLDGCAKCTTSVAELAGMPGLLALIPRDQILADTAADHVGTEPGGAVLIDLVETVARKRRRQRAAMFLAAAVTLVGFTVPTGFLIADQNSDVTVAASAGEPTVYATPVRMNAVIPSTLIATTSIASTPWGSQIVLDCSYSAAAPGDTRYGTEPEEYSLSVTDASGIVTTLATWRGRPGETVRPTATTSNAPGSIRSIQVRATDSDQILLTTPA